jgi:hypothetical protein
MLRAYFLGYETSVPDKSQFANTAALMNYSAAETIPLVSALNPPLAIAFAAPFISALP